MPSHSSSPDTRSVPPGWPEVVAGSLLTPLGEEFTFHGMLTSALLVPPMVAMLVPAG